MKILITDMPGPVWWELWMQWGGVFTQLLAVSVTFSAVWLALRVARRDTAWRQEQQDREAGIVLEIASREAHGALYAATAIEIEIDDMLTLHAPSDPGPRLARLDYVSPNFKFEGCWRLVEKLAWLPPEVGSALAEVMAGAPGLIDGVRQLTGWPPSSKTWHQQLMYSKEVCQSIIKCCQVVLDEKQKNGGIASTTKSTNGPELPPQ